MKDIYIS